MPGRDPTATHYIKEPGGQFLARPIPRAGLQPLPHGPVILSGNTVWNHGELRRLADLADVLVPQALMVLAPQVALPEFVPATTPLDRQDFRPVATALGQWQTLRGCTVPDVGAIFICLSSVVPPTDILVHEAWHFAECLLLTDDEISQVAQAYAGFRRLSESAGARSHPEPDEWAANLFASWYAIGSQIGFGNVRIGAPLHDIFTALDSGDMGQRTPRTPRGSVRDDYHTLAGTLPVRAA